MTHTGETARAVAEREIEQEDFDETVIIEKKRIRRHVPFWHRIFPYTITIERRKYNDDE